MENKKLATCLGCFGKKEIVGRDLCKKCYELERNHQMSKNYYDIWKSLILKTFGNQCKDCKKTYIFMVYDLHHNSNLKKKYNISALMRRKPSFERINELSKCILLCANCHRIRHAQENYIKKIKNQ